MIVIINGPLGVGKTETSWQLIEHFDKAIMLDADYIVAAHPFEIYNAARVDYLYETLAHNVAWHVAHGYHNFVVNYVFEKPESLAKLRHLLSAYDDVTYAFRSDVRRGRSSSAAFARAAPIPIACAGSPIVSAN